MAVTSEVGIYNLALNAIGERSNVSSPTETSRRAEVCNLWYDSVKDQILGGAPWPEATTVAYLAQYAEQDDDTWTAGEPAPGYNFSYALPSDCLRPRYLTNFDYFLVAEYSNTRLLNCNTEDAILNYTKRLDNVALWSSDLIMAVAYGLAAHICMPLSGKPSRARTLAERANELVISARVAAANTNNQIYETVPDWIRGRGYAQTAMQRYHYPTGSLLVIANVE